MATETDQTKDDIRRRRETSGHPRIDSSQLFGRSQQVIIEHRGVDYLLRVTRHDKLILTK